MSHRDPAPVRSTIKAAVTVTIGAGSTSLAVAVTVTGKGLACVVVASAAAVLVTLVQQLPACLLTLRATRRRHAVRPEVIRALVAGPAATPEAGPVTVSVRGTNRCYRGRHRKG